MLSVVCLVGSALNPASVTVWGVQDRMCFCAEMEEWRCATREGVGEHAQGREKLDLPGVSVDVQGSGVKEGRRALAPCLLQG